MSGQRRRWAVVGGGMVGITVAHRLAQAGQDVTLLERAPALGGLAAPWQLGPVTWDRFYHVTLFSDAALRSLLAEVGLDEQIEWCPTRTACLTDGRLLPVSTPLEFARFSPISFIDRARLGLTVLYAGHRSSAAFGRSLEHVRVQDWLTKLSGKRAFDRFWLPLLRAKLGTGWTDSSASFIWATAQRLGKARRSGLGDERFGYVPGGYATVVTALGELLDAGGVHVRTGVELRSADAGRITFADGTTEQFDEIVLTISARAAESLAPGLSDAERSRLAAIRYQGVICVSLLLNTMLWPYYLTYLLDDQGPAGMLTGIVDMSSLIGTEQLGGHGLVYLPRYCAPDDPLFDEPDQTVIGRFIDALCAVHPAFDRSSVVVAQVARAREVFAIPTLGYSERVMPLRTTMAGVSIVHSAQIVNGTLNVDEGVQLAERAVAELLGHASAPAPARVANTALATPAGKPSVPIASLSLDLDNEWAYLMTHGNPDWQRYPTYLPVVVPHVLDILDRLRLRITFFVVGQDATRSENTDAIASLATSGHEIANHSFRHQPWLHRYTVQELDDELARAEDAIGAVTGQQTIGFRGPGYSLSPAVLEALSRRGYRYDASTLPTYIGPLARQFYFRSAKLTAEQRAERSLLFGTWHDGTRPLRPYRWATSSGPLTEVPVTTLPGLRVPIHVSYLLYLSAVNPVLARTYFAGALTTCRAAGVAPSILLHPLDFLGGDEVDSLSFFPGMHLPGSRKRELVEGFLGQLARRYTIVPMIDHATAVERSAKPRVRELEAR